MLLHVFRFTQKCGMDGNKPTRQVLAACDGNTKCSPPDTYTLASGEKKYKYLYISV